MEKCIFCKILNGDIPAKKVYEDDYTLAFNDISPQIKARYQFEIESGTDYLLKLIGTEQTTSRVFDMVIIYE